MIQAGHSFIDKTLDTDIRAMFDAMDGYKHFEEVVPMDFVHVHEQWGKQVVGRVTSKRHNSMASRTRERVYVPRRRSARGNTAWVRGSKHVRGWALR